MNYLAMVGFDTGPSRLSYTGPSRIPTALLRKKGDIIAQIYMQFPCITPGYYFIWNNWILIPKL